MRILLPLIILMLTCIACNDIIDEKPNSDLIFRFAFKIDIPAYVYTSVNNAEISVSCDSCVLRSNSIDTLDSQPVFAWDTTGMKYVYCAVFSEHIMCNDREILNPEDIVWFWHTGFTDSITTEGYIPFNKGRTYTDMDLQTHEAARPLQPDRTYYLGIWAWTNDGKMVDYSSIEFPFFVK